MRKAYAQNQIWVFGTIIDELRQLLFCVGGFTIEIDGLGFEIVGRRIRIWRSVFTRARVVFIFVVVRHSDSY